MNTATQDTTAGAAGNDEVKTPDQLWAEATAARTSTQADDVDGNGGDQEDPLAGLPEPTRQLIQQIQAKTKEQEASLTEVGKKLATAHGTIGDLSHKLNQSLVELGRVKPVIDAAEATRAAEEKTAKEAKEARRKELKENMAELPDIVEYIDSVMADVKPAAKPEAPVTPVKAEETPEQITARLTAERELSDDYPKWIEKVRSPEFKIWRDKQPDDIKALGASDDVADARKMLAMFEKHKEDVAKIAKIEKDRQERLRRGESIEGHGSASKDGDQSGDVLWNKVKRDRAQRQAA